MDRLNKLHPRLDSYNSESINLIGLLGRTPTCARVSQLIEIRLFEISTLWYSANLKVWVVCYYNHHVTHSASCHVQTCIQSHPSTAHLDLHAHPPLSTPSLHAHSHPPLSTPFLSPHSHPPLSTPTGLLPDARAALSRGRH